MNIKLAKYVKDEGYCCLWAWLEANRAKLTSKLAADTKGVCTLRALQQNRAKHRAKETQCEKLGSCLQARIKAGHTIVLHPRKADDTSSGG